MRAQLKVVLLVAVVLVATLSAVVWKSQGLLLEDKLRFINDSSLKQIAPLKRLVSEKIDSNKASLVRFATTREVQGAGHSSTFGNFDVVALMEPAEPGQAQWSPTWVEKGPNARAEKWPVGYDVTLLKSLPYAKLADGQALWVRLSDSQGAPVYAVLVSVEVQSSAPIPLPTPIVLGGSSLPDKPTTSAPLPGSQEAELAMPTLKSGPRRAVVVGFASENPLASVTEDYIGSLNTVFILDDRGYVASHIDKAYLGSLFSEDSIAKEVMKSPSKLSGTGEYEDMEGRKVIGHYERVENTNLTVVITTPITAATSIVDQSLRNTILVGGSVGFLGLILAWLVGSSLGGPVRVQPLKDRAEEKLEDRPRPTDLGDISAGVALSEDGVPVQAQPPSALKADSQAQPLQLANDVGAERLAEERKYAYQAFHSTLAARLREPLLAVIGHVQLVKTKTQDEAVLAHADSIEREARLAKDSIEHWQILEEAPSLPNADEKVDLEKVALNALADKAIELEGSGVIVSKETSAVPLVRGGAKELETALGNMIENAIEAMRDRPTKRLALKLTMVGTSIRLSLEDTGIGMSRDVREKAFEPFFKAFAAPRHMGLGLAFAQSAFTRAKATLEIESSPGEGARFVAKFPVDLDAKKEFEAKKKAASAPPIQSVAKPDVLKADAAAVKKETAASSEPTKLAEPSAQEPFIAEPAVPEITATGITTEAKRETPRYTLGGKEALPDDAASALPPFPGTPVSAPLTNTTSQKISADALTPLSQSQPDADDADDDKFKSVSISATSSPASTESVTPETPDVEDSNETSGTEWQVKIRRPKPKGQS